MHDDDQRKIDEQDISRWKIGHRFFFVQIQSLIIALRKFEASPSEKCLNDIAALLLGSGTMMQYAANFLGGRYAPIRDSMAHLADNFSGSFSGDHFYMLRGFKKLPPAKMLFPDEYDNFRECLEATYKAHAYVCHKFAGNEGSLANDNIVAWREIATRLLSRALKIAGVEDSEMPRKFGEASYEI